MIPIVGLSDSATAVQVGSLSSETYQAQPTSGHLSSLPFKELP